MDAHIHRDHFGALLTIVSQLMAFAGYHGPTASFFGVTPEVAQKVRLLYVFLIESRPPKARDADIEELPMSLRKLDGIVRYLHSGSAATRLEIPPSYKYWKRCEASVLPGVDACVKLPAGKEMACCSKVSTRTLPSSLVRGMLTSGCVSCSASACDTAPQVRPLSC